MVKLFRILSAAVFAVALVFSASAATADAGSDTCKGKACRLAPIDPWLKSPDALNVPIDPWQ